jgi:hypothetical protein
MVLVPVAAVADAVSVSVDVLAVTAAGLKAAVTPLGRFSAARLTVPAKPPVRVRVIVAVPLAPWLIARVVGATAIV